MVDEVSLCILWRGIWPGGTITGHFVASSPSRSASTLLVLYRWLGVLCPPILKSLTGSGFRSSKERQVLPLIGLRWNGEGG